MSAVTSLLIAASLAQGASAESDRITRLNRACEIVQRAYPLLMLAVMAEGPMDCGDPDSDEFLDCDANDTPEQSARQAQRLEIRQRQEAVFKEASEACDAWAVDRSSPSLQEAVERTFRSAREIGTDLPPEVMD